MDKSEAERKAKKYDKWALFVLFASGVPYVLVRLSNWGNPEGQIAFGLKIVFAIALVALLVINAVIAYRTKS